MKIKRLCILKEYISTAVLRCTLDVHNHLIEAIKPFKDRLIWQT